MSKYTESSPRHTSRSVLHVPHRKASPSNDANDTANSSSFVSHPSEASGSEDSGTSSICDNESNDASTCQHAEKLSMASQSEGDPSTSSLEFSDKKQDIETTDKDESSHEDENFSRVDNSVVRRTSPYDTSSKHSHGLDSKHSQNDEVKNLEFSGEEESFTSEKSPFKIPSKLSVSLQNSFQALSPRPESPSEFQSSSFLDETKAQFDLDINIDDYQLNTRQRQGSPWKNFRSSGANQYSARQASLLSRRDFSEASVAGVASTEKIEDLSKQLTNCKIQLKLYEKFLQDLIDSQSIDVDDITTLQQKFDYKQGSSIKSSQGSPLKPASLSPEKEVLEMTNLLEDLYASLEEYQSKWRDADNRIAGVSAFIRTFFLEVQSVFHKLGINVSETVDHEATERPEECLHQILRVLQSLPTTLSASRSSPPKNSLSSPRESFSQTNSHSFQFPTQIRDRLTSGYESITSTPHKPETRTTVEENIDSKLQEYQAMIDGLQREVNELKEQSRVGSVSDISDHTFFSHGSRDREKLLLMQKDHENLQAAHHDLIEEHHRYKMSMERTVASLRNQSENYQREKLELRSELTAVASIQRDLEVSVEKQRVLTTEKIKLSYQVEALVADKTSLQKNIDKLTERLATMSERNAPSFEALRKQTTDASDALDRIFEVDLEEFEKSLRSFNKIADDGSLEDPRQKINFLISFRGTKLLDQNQKVLSTIEDAHKSVLRFFSRAIEVIVTDHIRLLLKENEQKGAHDSHVRKLKEQIVALEERIKQMNERHEYMPSPRSKLRIEELTSRWKAEREARVLENRQAKKRLHELGQEARTNTS